MHRYRAMGGRRGFWTRLVAPASALIVVGAVSALVVAVVRGHSGSRDTALKAGAERVGCGAHMPPNASTVGDRATLVVGGVRGTWQVTITNDSKMQAALNRKLDLVALDDQDRIIGETRMPDAGGSFVVLEPHQSWTAAVRPVAESCSAPPRPLFPTIPAGTYKFVVASASARTICPVIPSSSKSGRTAPSHRTDGPRSSLMPS